MALEIREINPTRSNLKKFVTYPTDYLYKDNKCYVPALVLDDLDTLNPKTNPAFDFCEGIYFMAYRDGKPVGRIVGIINTITNKLYNEKKLRFGFVDFADDAEAVDGLFKAVEDWGRSKGMEDIVGPLGFTDLDPEGMLVEGYDQLGTMSTIYNHPYYVDHMERMGFVKENDWMEFKVYVPEAVPEKMARVSEIVKKKYGVQNITYKTKKQLVKERGQEMFDLINEAYSNIYGYSPLTQRQIDKYIGIYLPVVHDDEMALIGDADGKLVGVGLVMPSLSKALIRGRGRLFPMGWWHLVRALFMGKSDIVDLLLVAVKPEYQNKGVNSLLFTYLIPTFIRRKYKWAETNPEMEANHKVQSQWQYFKTEQHKRRRAYKKSL